MRPTSDALADVVRGGSFTRELVGDFFRGSTRTMVNVPITDWTLNGDLSAEIKTSASISVAYTGDFADSITPRDFTDALAPFGQEVRLYIRITAGPFDQRVPVGVYRIESVPQATDVQMRFRQRTITVGSTVQLTLLDRFHGVKRDRFRSLEQTSQLTSAYAEFARITGLQVTKTLPDAAIPNSTVYGRERLAAAQKIANILGGSAYMTADGTASIIPTIPGAAIARLAIGEEGVILDVQYSMQSEDVYNCVIGDFETDDGLPIHAEATITSGPLAIDGPYGYNTTEYPNDQKAFIKTQIAANVAVANHLAIVSSYETYELPVQCIFDPRLEIGDVVEVERQDRLITGRITKYTAGKTGPMSLTLGVLNDITL